MRYLITAGLVLLSGTAHAEYFYGQRATVQLGMSGCVEVKTENRLAELLLEHDMDAAIKLAMNAGPKCRLFEPGEAVNVEGNSKPHSLICVRPKGATDCYWYPSNYMK